MDAIGETNVEQEVPHKNYSDNDVVQPNFIGVGFLQT